MCGSSLEPRDWDVLMAGELADVVWTDPPYNVDIGGKNDNLAKAQGRKNKTGAILNDSMDDKAFYEFLLAMYRAVFDQGDHRELVGRLLAAPPPRLLTIATDTELLRLPWELMADERDIAAGLGRTAHILMM